MKLMCHKPFNKIHIRNPLLVNVLKINLIYLKKQIAKHSSTKYQDMINKDNDLLIKFKDRTSQTMEVTPDAFRNFINALFICNDHRKEIKPNIIKTTKQVNKFLKEVTSLYQALTYFTARSWLATCFIEINSIDGIKGVSDEDFNKVKTWLNKAYLCSYYGTPKMGTSAFPVNIKRAIGFNILVPYKIVLKLKHASISQLNELKESLINEYTDIKLILSIN